MEKKSPGPFLWSGSHELLLLIKQCKHTVSFLNFWFLPISDRDPRLQHNIILGKIFYRFCECSGFVVIRHLLQYSSNLSDFSSLCCHVEDCRREFQKHSPGMLRLPRPQVPLRPFFLFRCVTHCA